jgi:adenine-specific DNA-methyltransferase
MTNNNYENLPKEELIKEIERLKKELKNKKKYGLVWEEKPEEVIEMCKHKLPILKEDKEKEIITDKEKPINLLIEGDNYHALSVLNYTHNKKVDVIYIDPPYNTGNKDFIFNDRYVDPEDAYRHSKWLSFMEKRLKLAKNLLKDTGVIFISIDDNEVAQLKLLMDDPNLFGEKNFIANIIWQKAYAPVNLRKTLSPNHDFILCYAENIEKVTLNQLPRTIESERRYKNPDNDSRGPWKSTDLSVGPAVKENIYEIVTPKGRRVLPPKGRSWVLNKQRFHEFLKDNRIWFGKDGNSVPSIKKFLSEVKTGMTPLTIWLYEEVGHNQDAKKEIKTILDTDLPFETPKPLKLMKRILKLASQKESLILDFFAGSGTTGHAVLELNKEDGGNRKFILCTNNENNNGNGYKIAEDICYPRIKKVIEGYKNLKGENVEGLGGNLKYFKTDFADAEPTDKNKLKLTEQATEMLCIKEGTFESVIDNEKFKLFKNSNHYTGIIWDQTAIPEFKKKIKDIKGKLSIYVFSLGDETSDDEFSDFKQKVQLSPIPEAILRVYRRIFR